MVMLKRIRPLMVHVEQQKHINPISVLTVFSEFIISKRAFEIMGGNFLSGKEALSMSNFVSFHGEKKFVI